MKGIRLLFLIWRRDAFPHSLVTDLNNKNKKNHEKGNIKGRQEAGKASERDERFL